MMYWSGDGNWAGWLTMTLSMVVFWAAIAWLIMVGVRQLSERSAQTPLQRLAERYAEGEIDEEEYARRRRVLHQ